MNLCEGEKEGFVFCFKRFLVDLSLEEKAGCRIALCSPNQDIFVPCDWFNCYFLSFLCYFHYLLSLFCCGFDFRVRSEERLANPSLELVSKSS